MQTYSYVGRRGDGSRVSGQADGEDAGQIASQLLSAGLTPLEIRAVGGKPSRNSGDIQISLPQKRVGITDLMLFARQMHALTKAGIPLSRALRSLSQSTENKRLAEVLEDIIDQLEAGRELAAGLAMHNKVFPPLFVNMVRVGENAGKLEESFQRLYQYLQFEKETRERITAALRYPTMVVIAIAVAVGILVTFVVPKFSTIFSAFGTDLPWPTQVIVGISNFAQANWGIILLALVGAYVALRIAIKTPAGRLRWDHLKLRLPVVGSIVRRASLARFARSFSMASRAGMPLNQAISLISAALDNAWLGERVRGMRDGLEHGDSLTVTARRSGLFTPLVLQMLAVGEETGNIDDIMDEVADFYDSEVKRDVENIGALIEPILIIAIGGMVLILALGVFLPMWELSGGASR